VLDYFGVGGRIKTVDASPPSAEAVYAAVRDLFRPAFVYVLGMPGTGKGTQCARLAQAYGYTHLSTGELMRAEVASGSDLGRGELAGALAAGVLVDSALVQRLLVQAMAGSACRRFLLDGFPRSLEQAEAFEAVHGLPNFVLHFEGAVEVLKARVLAAGKAAGGALRQDATEEAIAMRFEQYRSSEEAVVRAYDERRLVRSVGSLPPPDTVFARLRRLFQPPLVVLLRDAGCRHAELCARLGRELGYATLDVEALLAAEAASGSSHGKALAAAAAARRTPPIAPVLAVLERAMQANPAAQRFLLDGYPRLVSAGFPGVHDQVMAAEERLGAFKGAVVLSASFEARAARAGAKAPGELALVRARADAFRREKAPVVAFFDKLGKTCALDTTSASLEEMVESARPYLE
jgi:adenylate kinase